MYVSHDEKLASGPGEKKKNVYEFGGDNTV